MANFISNTASAELTAATLDLSTGNYYAHLVTTVPLLTHSTAADLVLPTIVGYASTPLTGLSYNSTRWTFDSFSFPKYTLVSAPTGVAICKRSGAAPASTDRFICYSDFNNSIGQGISLQVGTYVVNLQFGTNGAINFSYRYQYSSGAYVNTETVPPGLIYLIGTKNNTVAFANPTPLAVISTLPDTNDYTSRSFGDASAGGGLLFAIDFKLLRIKPGTIGIYNHYPTGNATVEIFGSNNLSNNFNANYNNLSFYTALGTFNVTGWSYNTKTFAVNSPDFLRYLAVRVTHAGNNSAPDEIEFYNSSILSPTQNFV